MPDTALQRETVTVRRTEGTDDASAADKTLTKQQQAKGGEGGFLLAGTPARNKEEGSQHTSQT